MFVLREKLKVLKTRLKVWNKEVFGDINLRVDKAKELLLSVQQDIDLNGPTDSLLAKEADLKKEFFEALRIQESFWKDKSRLRWITEGDRNSTFFHGMVKKRAAVNRLVGLQDSGGFITDPAALQEHVVSYFQTLYANEDLASSPSSLNSLVDRVIPALVTMEENDLLSSIPSASEIKTAVFALDPNSAPGPDGFSGSFFQHCWDIVGSDVVRAITDFFEKTWLPNNYNSNFIVLIPKVPEADSISQYRPIALANFIFKVIPKILADRLGAVASRIISFNQTAFIKGRRISDNICLASECFNQLDRKCYGGNVGIKFDIRKAFDTLRWDFIITVLQKFGFAESFVSWVNCLLHSAKMSVLINGSPFGYFSCGRGVRQGDPLSPLLFCLVEEVLSRGISQLVSDGKILPISSFRGFQAPTHMLYADDIMVFCRGNLSSINSLMNLFDEYGSMSGQILNKEKCRVHIGKGATHRRRAISNALGILEGQSSFFYLGVPIFKGKPRRCHLQPLADRAKAKLEGWQCRLLSLAGRAQLIQSVIHPMLLHSFMVYLWPASLIKQLNSWIRNFLWSGKTDNRKLITVPWQRVCSPKSEGGLGLRDITSVNKAAILKLSWDFVSADSACCRLFKARFCLNHSAATSSYRISSIWPGVKTLLPEVFSSSQWVIGNGVMVDFWHDAWIGDPLIHQLHISPGTAEKLHSHVSSFIVDRQWSLPSMLAEACPQVVDKIKQVALPLVDSVDVLVWDTGSSGSLSFAMAYDHCRYKSPIVPWSSKLWAPYIPPRLSTLLWRILWNRIPTDDLLQRRGWSMASCCSLCSFPTHSETPLHLFLHCDFATKMWRWLFDIFHVHLHSVFTSIMDFWLFLVDRSFSLQVYRIWVAAIMLVFSSIWRARNSLRFEDIQPGLRRMCFHIQALLADIGKVSKGVMQNSVFDLTVLHSFGIPGLPPKAPRIIPVCWNPPSPSWIKLNTDGLAKGNPGPAAVGGVFRNCRGFVQGIFCRSIGIHSAFYAELLAVIFGIELAWANGWKRLWLESDSSVVVSCFSNPSFRPPWQLRVRWDNCLFYRSQMEFVVSHIFREGNAVADACANLGLGQSIFQWWWNAPSVIQPLIFHDLHSFPRYRFR